MSGLKEKVIGKIVEYLSMFAGYNDSVKYTEKKLNEMSNKDFFAYVEKLGTGEEVLRYHQGNYGKNKVTVEKNFKIADKLGYSFFKKLWLYDDVSGVEHLTPIPYLVLDLPVRRQQQHLKKKISIPKTGSKIDVATGQPVNSPDSKGSSLSAPEVQIIYSHGHHEALRELFKFRGGDEEAWKNLNMEILANGMASMDAVDTGKTQATSTVTLGNYFKAMHLNNNLASTRKAGPGKR